MEQEDKETEIVFLSKSQIIKDYPTLREKFSDNAERRLSGRGKNIGQYILSEKLGEGTFGVVRLGTHIMTGEKVAVKILEKMKILETSAKVRVEREIKILKSLRHNNIVQLYSVIQTATTIYLIMEYANGKELFDYISVRKRLPEAEACKYYQQILSGIEYLHKLRIAHRDIKPENLLIDDKRNIKIVDFGLSNIYNKDELLKTACGSPCYAAPEMITGKKYSGLTADIWSSGIVLFVMLCGYLPFEERNNDALYKKISEGRYIIPIYISDAAKDILKRILTVDPNKRYTINQIKTHPWFNLANPYHNINDGLLIHLYVVPIDEELVEQMEEFGFNKDEVRTNLLTNKHNHITTTYYLLLKNKIRRGIPSIADLISERFLKYIGDPANLLSKYQNDFNLVIRERVSGKDEGTSEKGIELKCLSAIKKSEQTNVSVTSLDNITNSNVNLKNTTESVDSLMRNSNSYFYAGRTNTPDHHINIQAMQTNQCQNSKNDCPSKDFPQSENLKPQDKNLNKIEKVSFTEKNVNASLKLSVKSPKTLQPSGKITNQSPHRQRGGKEISKEKDQKNKRNSNDIHVKLEPKLTKKDAGQNLMKKSPDNSVKTEITTQADSYAKAYLPTEIIDNFHKEILEQNTNNKLEPGLTDAVLTTESIFVNKKKKEVNENLHKIQADSIMDSEHRQNHEYNKVKRSLPGEKTFKRSTKTEEKNYKRKTISNVFMKKTTKDIKAKGETSLSSVKKKLEKKKLVEPQSSMNIEQSNGNNKTVDEVLSKSPHAKSTSENLQEFDCGKDQKSVVQLPSFTSVSIPSIIEDHKNVLKTLSTVASAPETIQEKKPIYRVFDVIKEEIEEIKEFKDNNNNNSITQNAMPMSEVDTVNPKIQSEMQSKSPDDDTGNKHGIEYFSLGPVEQVKKENCRPGFKSLNRPSSSLSKQVKTENVKVNSGPLDTACISSKPCRQLKDDLIKILKQNKVTFRTYSYLFICEKNSLKFEIEIKKLMEVDSYLLKMKKSEGFSGSYRDICNTILSQIH